MWGKIIPELKRWFSRYLVVTMLLSFVFSNSFVWAAFAAPEGGGRDTATPSDAVKNGKVSLKNSTGAEQKVWISILSHEAGYEAGDEVCLDIYIKNNTDQEISDGILKYRAKGILEDSGYFEEMDSLYDGSGTGKAGEDFENRADPGAFEEKPEDGSDPEISQEKPEDGAEGREDQELSDEDAWWDDEDSEEDQPEDKLTGLRIGPGEVYQAQFYFTIDDSIETVKSQKVTFKFQGEDEEGKQIFINEDFYYGVGAMNLLPIELGTAGYFLDGDTEDVQGAVPAGAEGKMLLSFDLGDIEDMILEEILESGSRWEEASSADGRPASGSQAEREEANPDKTASSSAAQHEGNTGADGGRDGADSSVKTASSSQAEQEGEGSGTNPWIKWDGEAFGTSKKERPIVKNLTCEVEAWGVKLNRFRKVNKALEDEYDISSFSTFQIDPETEPGVYYGKVSASYQMKGQTFKSTQGFILTVTEGMDEEVARVIALIDEIPEFEEAAETLAGYEEAEDDEGYAAYYLAIGEQVASVHGEYLALTEAQQEKVTNREKLLTYVEMFGVQTLETAPIPSSTDKTTIPKEDCGLTFKLYNYDKDVNKNGLQRYFNFRGFCKDNEASDPRAHNEKTDANDFVTDPGKEKRRAKVKLTLEGGYPAFSAPGTSVDGESLGYLFGSNTNAKGVQKYEKISNTFLYDKDGYYTYDCAEYAVDYDTKGNKFYVRDSPERGNGAAKQGISGEFMPFTYSNLQGDKDYHFMSGTEGDYWFGMTMEGQFFQPKNGKNNDENMTFYFSGDDDIWVFIDGVLVLDLGGVHSAKEGTIDFATGTVVQDWDNNTTQNTTIKTCFENAGKASTVRWKSVDNTSGEEERYIFEDYTQHTINFFYLERGAGVSNCKMSFNLATLPDKSLTVAKELTIPEDSNQELADLIQDSLQYKFRVVKANDAGEPTGDTYLSAGTKYDIWEDGKKIGRGTVEEGGYFYLKAGQSAQFAQMISHANGTGRVNYFVEEIMPADLKGQYDQVEYEVGQTTGTIETEDQTAEDFVAFTTEMLSADQAQMVTYRNKVDTSKLGMLKITKEEVPGSIFAADKTFDIQVKLGGNPLEAGTKYQVTGNVDPGAGGTEKEAGENGTIQLKIGETATISKGILSGTEYEIQEIIPENEKFQASYSGTMKNGDGEPETITFDGSSNMAKGEFGLNSTVHVTVKNQSYAFSGRIPIVKECIGNRESAEFHFNVEEAEGFDPNNPSKSYQVKGQLPGTSITVANDEETEGEILIGYSSGQEGTYYYKVSEQRGDDNQFIYDDSFYIVEMTVSDNKAEITNIWLNGERELDKGSELPFRNYRSVPLTIKKIVAGEQEPQTGESFTFTVKITKGGDPLILPKPTEEAEVMEDGTVKISLKHGEEMVIPVPVGADVTVTEASHDGYRVSYSYTIGEEKTAAEGDSVTIQNMSAPCQVEVTNIPGIRLPDTGGPGLLMFNRYGWMLLLLALLMTGMEVCFYGNRTRKQEEGY